MFVKLSIYDENDTKRIKFPYDNNDEQSMLEAFEKAFNTISEYKSNQIVKNASENKIQ